jgi:hypothetical protein
MTYTSKTLIPWKEPIGRNRDGSYIYDGVQTQNMSVMPAKGTFDATKLMSVIPKVYTPPTVLPMVQSPLGFNTMPQVNKEIAQKINAPVNDALSFKTKIDETAPRVQQLRQHFRTLEQKWEFQLNDKQTEYIRKFKAKYPDYANVPDVSLYSKIILAEPKAMEQYGNIGNKTLLQRVAQLPAELGKTGGNAIMEAQDNFSERNKTLWLWIWWQWILAAAWIWRAIWSSAMWMAGDVLNVASPFINPNNEATAWVTSITEWLQRDLWTAINAVPEEYRKAISDVIAKYPKISESLWVAFDLSNLIPVLDALNKAKSIGEVDTIINTIKARPATKFRGAVSQAVFDAGQNRSLIKDAASIPLKTGAAALKWTAKTGEFAGETAIATGVGISKPSQQAIKAAPEMYQAARTGSLTRETATNEVVTTLKKRLWELSDTGKEYNTIRNADVVMPKNDFGNIVQDFLKKNDVSKIDMTIKDRKVIQQAIDYIAEYGDNLTAKNGLSLRKKLDDLADWWTEATEEGKRLVRMLRKDVDSYLGDKIPWLKTLDAKYAPEVKFLKKVKSGILNADWTIKDSAISYVANIVGKGKEMKLDRLEQLLPWIGQKVRALKAFEEVQAISSMKSILRQLSWVVAWNTIFPWFGAVAWFIATNPNIVAYVLEKYGMAKKAISSLLKKGAKITPEEAQTVKKAVNAVPKEEVATYLLWAWEQRKLLMPPKAGDSIIKWISKSDSPIPSSSSPLSTKSVSNAWTSWKAPQTPQWKSWKPSVLSQLSKEKSISAWGEVKNTSIIQKIKEKKAPTIVEKIKKAKKVKTEPTKTPQETKFDTLDAQRKALSEKVNNKELTTEERVIATRDMYETMLEQYKIMGKQDKIPELKSQIKEINKVIEDRWYFDIDVDKIKKLQKATTKSEKQASDILDDMKKKYWETPKSESAKVGESIKSTEWYNDFVDYFQKDLWDTITVDWLKKFWFTEKQILDNTYDFLKTKDNELWVSLEDLFAIAKKEWKATPQSKSSLPMGEKAKPLIEEAKKYKNSSDFVKSTEWEFNALLKKEFPDNSLEVSDIYVVGSSATWKVKPNDIDIAMVVKDKKTGKIIKSLYDFPIKWTRAQDALDVQNRIEDFLSKKLVNGQRKAEVLLYWVQKDRPHITLEEFYNKVNNK